MSLQITRQDLPIRVTASGSVLKIPVFQVTSGLPGPKVYLQANIHGPEIAGIGAIYDFLALLRSLNTVRGTLTIVPSVNPLGLDSKVSGHQTGYADLNETVVGNFNRIYQLWVTDKPSDDPEAPQKVVLDTFAEQHRHSDLPMIKQAFRAALGAAIADYTAKNAPYGMRHGQKLALTIQRLSYDADYLIDLHTAGDAIYHLFTFEECLSAARYFNLRHTIQLDESFSGVLDEAFLQPWLRLQKAFQKLGRTIPFADFGVEAFTPELGSADTLDRIAMREDAERVANYLRYRGVLDGRAIRHEGEFFYAKQDHYRRYHAPTGGLILWHKRAGDHIMAGETIATLLRTYALEADGTGETEIPIVALEDGVIISASESQVTHEGMGICSILTRLQSL
jgi:hypothetical protein